MIGFIYSYRSTLPRPLSQVEAQEQDDFSGIHSYNEYLSHFNTPHSANQQGNADMYHWLSHTLTQFADQAEKNNIKVDLITNDTTNLVVKRDRYSEDEYWYVESRNVMIRLHGQQGSVDNALMINAHYDSVSTSHGVTDNGMGTATALELLNYFVQNPPQRTLIFLFNNYEEGGLIGAQSFVNHPWFSTIKLFVNLEGTGSGGRSLLFRSSNLNAVKKLASSRARLLHASPFGNDLLKSKLIRSDTDYTTFTGKGVPGLDIAFYTPRSHYHTQRDDLVHTTPSALQHMGQMALGVVRELDQTPITDNKDDVLADAKMERFIYFDILGRVMLVYSFETSQIINIVMLVITPLVALLWLVLQSRGTDKRTFWFGVLTTYGYGLISVLVASVFIGGIDALVIYALVQLKPLLTYGNAYLVGFYLTLASLLGLTLSQLVLTRIKRMHRILLRLNTSLYGLVTLWWGLLVYATVLGADEIAGGYFAIFFLVSGVSAILVSHALINKLPKARFPIVFIFQLTLPVIFMSEFCFLVIDALRHTTADGTPELSVYILMVIPIAIITLHLLPWIHVAGDKRHIVGVLTFALIVVFISCLTHSPYNRVDSPNRIVFHQEYNQIESTSTVQLVTGEGLDKILDHYLPEDEAATVQCEDQDHQIMCKYETKDVPARAQERGEYKMDIKNEVIYQTQRIQLTTTVKHSQLCQIKMNVPIHKAQVNGQTILPEGSMQAVMSYIKQVGQPVQWEMDVAAHGNHTVQLSCLYDDWTQGELPAFTHLRNRLPENQALTIKGGVGLSVVHYPVVYLQ
ncbi:uncharacterized protein BX664DRAFT_270385 [Halteromyces radiatus]|uniref:uncharacterized protein n=1 Tax=Halteromyces radiatus TaxID=101107 RepID=UPI002220C7A9|nr:uncharacterized protein BX664DRAFT_270385 [Halteromyces radiatus]KAI8077690.1 hypothetical protein BX664DRAFT_270385 [Halteromyces radiatus]